MRVVVFASAVREKYDTRGISSAPMFTCNLMVVFPATVAAFVLDEFNDLCLLFRVQTVEKPAECGNGLVNSSFSSSAISPWTI